MKQVRGLGYYKSPFQQLLYQVIFTMKKHLIGNLKTDPVIKINFYMYAYIILYLEILFDKLQTIQYLK